MKLPGHRFELRIYYEDTDHGGVVYYANYLKYMERARTEFMRCLGIDLGLLQHDDGVLFAVTEAHVHYRRPARFNDALCVVSSLGCAKGARLGFHQAVLRGSELLVDGEALAHGSGRSKGEAEREAAELALTLLGLEPDPRAP